MKHLWCLLLGCCLTGCKKNEPPAVMQLPAQEAARAILIKKVISRMVGTYVTLSTCQTTDSAGNLIAIDTTFRDTVRVSSFQDTVLVVNNEHLYYDETLDLCCHGFDYSIGNSYFDIAIADTGYYHFGYYRFQTASLIPKSCTWNLY